MLAQENAIESALHSFFATSSDWIAESQFCSVLYNAAPLTPSQIKELRDVIYSPTILPDGSVDAVIELGAGSTGDAQISPPDTGLSRPSGDTAVPLYNNLQPAESDLEPSQKNLGLWRRKKRPERQDT